MKVLRIGVVGYSAKKFDTDAARYMLDGAFRYLEMQHEAKSVDIVSGLTMVGVPAIAYELAKKHGYLTTGIACKKAEEYECFPVDNKYIIGDEWGDESEIFLRSIDVLVRVGGGEQSLREAKLASKLGIPTMEFDLPEEK